LSYQPINRKWEMAEFEHRPHGWPRARRFVVARRFILAEEAETTWFSTFIGLSDAAILTAASSIMARCSEKASGDCRHVFPHTCPNRMRHGPQARTANIGQIATEDIVVLFDCAVYAD
jgi:hypothetical protein